MLGTLGEKGGPTTAARASKGQCPDAPLQGTCKTMGRGPNAGEVSQAPRSRRPEFPRGLRGIKKLKEELPAHISQGDDSQDPLR